MTIQILVVDDEMIVRRGLKALVPWAEFGMEVVSEAANGEKALNILKQQPIDLVITDIRMPIIDGLELTRIIKRDYPHIKVLLLTCYNDFEYVKEALEIGASGYLLKTEMEEDGHLENALSRIRSEFEQMKTNQEMVRELQRQASQSLPLLREKWLRSLLTGDHYTELKQQSDKLALRWLDKPCLLLLIMYKENVNAAEETVSKALQDGLGEANAMAVRLSDRSYLVLIEKAANISKQKGMEWENHTVLTVYAALKSLAPASGQVQLYYRSSRSMDQLPAEYSNLLQFAEQHAFYHELGTVEDTHGMELPEAFEAQAYVNGQDVKRLAMIRNWSRLKEMLAEVTALIQDRKPSVESVKMMVIDIVLAIMEGLQSNSHIISSLWGSNKFDYMERVKKIPTFKELTEWLMDGIGHLEAERSVLIGGVNKVIAKAAAYIETHFHEEVTLEQLAEHVGLSKSYLSSYFKKVTGESFIDYMLQLRVEKAKELFRQTNLKIYEVAEAVGFQDPKYFTKSFKRITGVSPNQYKEAIEK
ncbi:response regulator transcription factor [Paenibacillus naphthalenovorans]|uniref:response regulator transcription factor n=1 Tax=Paenibacillus naphthalenovorans TaxID=162209 RepID=UPI003D2B4FD9